MAERCGPNGANACDHLDVDRSAPCPAAMSDNVPHQFFLRPESVTEYGVPAAFGTNAPSPVTNCPTHCSDGLEIPDRWPGQPVRRVLHRRSRSVRGNVRRHRLHQACQKQQRRSPVARVRRTPTTGERQQGRNRRMPGSAVRRESHDPTTRRPDGPTDQRISGSADQRISGSSRCCPCAAVRRAVCRARRPRCLCGRRCSAPGPSPRRWAGSPVGTPRSGCCSDPGRTTGTG